VLNEMQINDAEQIAKLKIDLSLTLLEFSNKHNLSREMTILLLESASADYWLIRKAMLEKAVKP
jgi:hypothetical protein